MRKVIIIGKGFGWENAPSISNEFDTWGITQLILRRPVDLVIDMNRYDDFRWGELELEENAVAIAMCKEGNIPYIGLHNYKIKEMISHFETDYFSSTIDYAIALAIYSKYEEIQIYGVNLSHNTEYGPLKPGVDFWCGMAKGRGIKLAVHGKDSTIMKTIDGLVYGYDTPQGKR